MIFFFSILISPTHDNEVVLKCWNNPDGQIPVNFISDLRQLPHLKKSTVPIRTLRWNIYGSLSSTSQIIKGNITVDRWNTVCEAAACAAAHSQLNIWASQRWPFTALERCFAFQSYIILPQPQIEAAVSRKKSNLFGNLVQFCTFKPDKVALLVCVVVRFL